MKTKFVLIISAVLCILNAGLQAQSTKFSAPIVDGQVIFEEKDGLVAVEAEYFYKQSLTEIRTWYRTSKNELQAVGRDDDAPHLYGPSNNA